MGFRGIQFRLLFLASWLFTRFFLALCFLPLSSTFLQAAVEGKPLDLEPIGALRELERERLERSFNVERFIPAHQLSEGDSLQKLSERILRQTARSLVEDSPLSRRPVTRSVERLGDTLGGDLSAKMPHPSDPSRGGGIEHQLSFRVRAEQGRAFLRYRGLTDAELSYNLFGQAIRFEINEQLTSKLQLLLIHEISHEEVIHEVNVRWIW